MQLNEVNAIVTGGAAHEGQAFGEDNRVQPVVAATAGRAEPAQFVAGQDAP